MYRLIAAVFALATASCNQAPAPTEILPPVEPPPLEPPPAVELFTDDLAGITERGKLRILIERESDTFLPRHGAALYAERDLATKLADHLGLDAEFVFVDRFSDLLPALREGRGDVAADNLTITDARLQEFAFTQPLDYSRDTLAVLKGLEFPDTDAALSGTIAARAETTLLDTARRLAEQNEGLQVNAVDTNTGNEGLIDQLAGGAFDYVVQDSNVLDRVLKYRDDISAGPAVSEPRPVGWAVRRNNPNLLAAIDEYLAAYYLLAEAEPQFVADLPELKQRGRIRMITRNNAATYFMWRGQLLGFEYELAKRFAEREGLRLEIVVAPSHDEMIPMLLDGHGDFIAAFLAPTEERIEQGVIFTRPYHYASEVVVGRADEPEITSLSDIAGRKIAVRRSSSYWTHLSTMHEEAHVDFELEEVPADMETQQIIDAVGDGVFDLSVADSHILAIEMTWRDDIKGLLNLGDEQPHAWAVRPEHSLLLEAMNDYLRVAYRGLEYNLSWSKYFDDPRYVRTANAALIAPGQISPYDSLARKFAREFDFDWRLLVAQMYQESHFDPEARSWVGAQGLMQVLPRTAAEFGFQELNDPETNIRAGVRYLAWVRERYPSDLGREQRMWFTLAGYNAGHGHVRDARRLARELGYDPNRWFRNVELAMLKLAEPEYSRRARHGYVRGTEPVRYVREIRQRFQAYTRLLAH